MTPAGDAGSVADRFRTFMGELSPPSEVRRLMETEDGYDRSAWTRLAEGGLIGLHLPPRYGGGGLGYTELALALEAAGEVLLTAPYLSTVVTAGALAATAGDDELGGLLPAVAAGRTFLAFAVAEAAGSWEPAAVRTAASPEPGGGWRLHGDKAHVLDGHLADLIVVAARDPSGELGLYAVEGDAPGLSRTTPRTVDLTRRQAHLRFEHVAARRLPGRAGRPEGLHLLLDLAAVALAAESLGGAQRCLDLSVAHARRRHQFGRPIGSFGAVQQTCADVLVDLELARAATRRAAEAADQGDLAELALLAPVARVSAADAYCRAAASAIQVHGGLGFTWDCDVQLYFKRARASALLLGDPRQHREHLAVRLGWGGDR